MNRLVSAKSAILIIEDDPNDEKLAVISLRQAGVEYPIEVCHNGEEAISRISELGAVGIRLVLLDIKLPKVAGLDVLAYMKHSFGDNCPPTVIFTRSNEDVDISRAVRLGAIAFVEKPLDFEASLATMKEIVKDWLEE